MEPFGGSDRSRPGDRGSGDAAVRLRGSLCRSASGSAYEFGLEVDAAAQPRRADHSGQVAWPYPRDGASRPIRLAGRPWRLERGIAVARESRDLVLRFWRRGRLFGESAVLSTLVEVWGVHSPTASAAVAGGVAGAALPGRLVIRNADRIVVSASRSSSPVDRAASPRSAAVELKP